MLARFSRRMLAVKTVVLFTLSGAAWMVQGADFDRARDLVSRVQNDLQRAEDFTRTNEKERSRYENVQHHLSESTATFAAIISIKANWIPLSIT